MQATTLGFRVVNTRLRQLASAIAASTAGAVKPTVDETIPAAKPIEGCINRLKRWYSPPDLGNVVPSSAYVKAPASAITPPITHNIRSENIDFISNN